MLFGPGGARVALWRGAWTTGHPRLAALRNPVAVVLFIVYRRLTMNAEPLERAAADEYAAWFAALADGTRVQIVSLLARSGEPMTVGQIVAAVPVGQSTVSAHLRRLAEVGFVVAEHRGTASWYRINQACVECFPTAADVVMGRPVPAAARFGAR
jgi:DNA-binding transcriptional ArsR family regulator